MELKKIIPCEDCKHREIYAYDEPCNKCEKGEYFEPKESKEELTDSVNHPSHYNYKSMECQSIIDVMVEGIDSRQAYPLGAAIKYLYRYPKKGSSVEDLQKAKTYIDMIIKKLEVEE